MLPGAPGGEAAVLHNLAALTGLGPYRLGPAVLHRIRDVYYDTEQRSFSAARVALRMREQDGFRWVTIKAGRRRAGALAEREESEQPLDACSLGRALADLVERGLLSADAAAAVDVVAFGAGQASGPLAPVLATATERVERAVFRGDAYVAELALDTICYEGLPVRAFYDIEAEAKAGGGEADLHALQELLQQAAGGALAPGTESKLARGLRLAAAQPRH